MEPSLAPGAPMSAERVALIEAFKQKSAGVETKFEAGVYKGDFAMPYRLFRPATSNKVPLIMYLHGSGGLGNDNQKQMDFGNIFGTRVWALPENQGQFPCYVVAPQTDRGWIRYEGEVVDGKPALVIPGLGDGARLAFEVVDVLRREFAIDDHRIYVTGQSMGGAGVWHMTAHRPRFFAAAIACCGSPTLEKAAESAGTPVWNFHGSADRAVPVAISRGRIAELKRAKGRVRYTEYAGVDHNVWEWAYTEPAITTWLFSQSRSS
jgi:predicted peptidase